MRERHSNSDIGLYVTKKIMFSEAMLVDGMSQAIKQKEFQVYLQPQYDIVSHCLTGAEALVHWQHPVMGLLAPMHFISIFEQNGVILELDLYVFEFVCGILEEWSKYNGRWVPISVNISRRDFYNDNLPELLHEIVVRHHITPCQIHLEITEETYIEEPEQLILVISGLREIGFVVEMDDFGKGYSSLNLLVDLPLDVLKLDMSFFHRKNRDRAQTIVRFMIALAKQLKLRVVAEGVETEEQVAALKEMGCHLCQGLFFGKPEPVEQFCARLNQEEILPDLTAEQNQRVEYPNKNHPETLIIVTQEQLDCRDLCDFFKDHYSIIAFFTWGEIQGLNWKFIQQHKKHISAIIFTLEGLPFYAHEVIGKIKESRDLEHIRLIPIVDVEKEKAVALEMGAADYIVRPFYREVTTAKVDKVIRDSIRYQEAEERAKRDSMTYLYHHASVETMIKSLLQEGITKGAFVLVDVDDFKQINDKFGHPVGDGVICEIAGKMKSYFKNTEIIGRIGGDEFAVFLSDYDYTDEYMIEMVERFGKGIDICRHGIRVTCSGGVSFYPKDGECFETLYVAADQALIKAKLKKHLCNRLDGLPDCSFLF